MTRTAHRVGDTELERGPHPKSPRPGGRGHSTPTLTSAAVLLLQIPKRAENAHHLANEVNLPARGRLFEMPSDDDLPVSRLPGPSLLAVHPPCSQMLGCEEALVTSLAPFPVSGSFP